MDADMEDKIEHELYCRMVDEVYLWPQTTHFFKWLSSLMECTTEPHPTHEELMHAFPDHCNDCWDEPANAVLAYALEALLRKRGIV